MIESSCLYTKGDKAVTKRFALMTAVFSTFFCVFVAQFNVSSLAGLKPPAPDTKWMAEPWIGNSKPYQEIQEEVNQAITTTRDLGSLVKRYKAVAQERSTDVTAQFRYAYAVYRVGHNDPYLKSSGEFTQAVQSLASIPSPQVYEFARLRFVLEASLGGYIYPLKPIGERLLHRTPNSQEIMFYLIKVLDDGRSDADKQQALVLSQKLVDIAPKSAYGYNLLGWTYYVIQMKSHQTSDGHKAIAAYRHSLQFVSPSNPSYAATERLIRLIQTLKANDAK